MSLEHSVKWWPTPSTLGVTVALRDHYDRCTRKPLETPGRSEMHGAMVRVSGSDESFAAAKEFLAKVVNDTAMLLTEDLAREDGQFLCHFSPGGELCLLQWESP